MLFYTVFTYRYTHELLSLFFLSLNVFLGLKTGERKGGEKKKGGLVIWFEQDGKETNLPFLLAYLLFPKKDVL